MAKFAEFGSAFENEFLELLQDGNNNNVAVVLAVSKGEISYTPANTTETIDPLDFLKNNNTARLVVAVPQDKADTASNVVLWIKERLQQGKQPYVFASLIQGKVSTTNLVSLDKMPTTRVPRNGINPDCVWLKANANDLAWGTYNSIYRLKDGDMKPIKALFHNSVSQHFEKE